MRWPFCLLVLNNSINMTRRFQVLLLSALLAFTTECAQGQIRQRLQSTAGKIVFRESDDNTFEMREAFRKGAFGSSENPRLVAIALDITLGVLGMHRLYLGTSLKVPIFYTLTLGGGCVLWVVDLGLLIFSKDIEPFKNNSHLFMWVKK
jgi:TM2 domain-containing membrane protein YozV